MGLFRPKLCSIGIQLCSIGGLSPPGSCSKVVSVDSFPRVGMASGTPTPGRQGYGPEASWEPASQPFSQPAVFLASGLDPPPRGGGEVVKKGPVWWQTPAPDVVHGDMLQRRMTVRREWWTEGADVTLCVSLGGDIILMRTRSNIFRS